MEHNPQKMSRESALRTTEQIIRANIANPNGNSNIVRCGDGRYSNTDTLGSLARLGADAGYLVLGLAATKKLGVSLSRVMVQKIIDTIENAIGGPSSLHFHTDEDHGPGIAAGCGFLIQVRSDPEAYGLTKELIQIIDEKLADAASKGAYIETLNGRHGEIAVAIVKGDLHLAPKNEFGQIFVYNEDMDKRRITDIAKAVAKVINMDTYQVEQEFIRTSDAQTKETFTRLGPNLPTVVVTGSVENLQITPLQ